MKIHDFTNCDTPVVECSPAGKVLDCNPAARKRLRGIRKGTALTVRSQICRLPCGNCFAVPHDGRLWLLFSDFLQFSFSGLIFPTAEETIALDAEHLLICLSELSRLHALPHKTAHLGRIRSLFYDRLSVLFSDSDDPRRYYRAKTFFDRFRFAYRRTEALGARISFFTDELSDLRYLNARNAAILLTALSTILLCHSSGGLHIVAADAGEFVRVSLTTVPDLPLPVYCQGEDLTELCQIFPAHKPDLLTADLCLHACDYKAQYETNADGSLCVDLYLAAQNDFFALLDPSIEQDPVEELFALISLSVKKVSQRAAGKLH